MDISNLQKLNSAIYDLDRAVAYSSLSGIEDAIQDVVDASGILGEYTPEQFDQQLAMLNTVDEIDDEICKLGIAFLIPKIGTVPIVEWLHALLLAGREVNPERLRGYVNTTPTM